MKSIDNPWTVKFPWKRQQQFLLLSACLLATFGCGQGDPNRGTVGGTVTLDTKPVEQGTIQLIPVRGTQGTVVGGAIRAGQYRLSGASGPAVGWNRVEILSPRKTGRKIPKGFGATGEMVDELVDAVASQYNSKSTLAIEIKPGDNVGNFEVRSK